MTKARNKAYDVLYEVMDHKEGENVLYRLARQRHQAVNDVQQVRMRSLPAISRPRSSHGTSIPSGALRPPLFLCCRPSSVERTADASERVPVVRVIQGQTKNSPLPPSLQIPCVVLVTFEHFQLFYLLCFYNYFTMHFSVGFIVLSYFVSSDSCN